MSWITAHRKNWRVAALVLLPVALIGPWWFDLIVVPAEHTCSPPNYRLGGDYCGMPVTGLWFFCWGLPGLVYASTGLINGAMTILDWFRSLFFSLFTFLLALPLIPTLLLVLRGDRRRRQVFSVVAWALAAGMGLLVGLSSYPRLSYVLWGVWLYIVLAVGALVLEVLTLWPIQQLDGLAAGGTITDEQQATDCE